MVGRYHGGHLCVVGTFNATFKSGIGLPAHPSFAVGPRGLGKGTGARIHIGQVCEELQDVEVLAIPMPQLRLAWLRF
jgi:hypothetical protein